MSSSTLAASPTMPTSTRTFLLIDEGSISMWIFFEPGEKASSRPVTRSSKRAPTADHHVAVVHGVVGLEGAVHAEHAEPLRVGGRKGAQAHQGRGHRRAGQRGEFAQQARWPRGRR